MELKGKKIVFLGDSITAGICTSGPEYTFAGIIGKKYECTTVNYGYGGTKIAMDPDEAEEKSLNFSVRLMDMDDDADIVVVMGGTNDFKYNILPIGKFGDNTFYTFYGACNILMRRLLNKYPGKPILIMTPLHTLTELDPYAVRVKKLPIGTLKDFVNVIREMAEYYSLPVLDLYAESGLQPAVEIIRKKYMEDGTHPNDEGHKLLAEKIAAKLLSM